MFEIVFGFWGLFLSFPALYVASKIANEWKAEDSEIVGARVSSPPLSKPSG